MCGRFALAFSPADLIAPFALDEWADFDPRWNIAPGADIPVVRRSPEGRRVLHLLRWGLVPHWSKDAAIGAKLNNARGETVAEKPSFRDAFQRRRCLIPASGFFEWRAGGGVRQPYYISDASGEPLALGGLWESWRAPDGSILRTVCIVTTGPNGVMAPIHDRMPVIVAPADRQAWLEAPADEAAHLVAPAPDEGLRAWPVNRRVNRAIDDDPGLIEPEEPAP